MKPPKRESREYEHVPKYEEWINGEIADIAYDQNYKKTFNGEEKIGPAVRFKFTLEGCAFPKYSRWLTFSYGEKANLYKKFVSALVEGAAPDMDFDLDLLKGMKIKTIWTRNEDFDNLEMIRPLGAKLVTKIGAPVGEDDESIPF